MESYRGFPQRKLKSFRHKLIEWGSRGHGFKSRRPDSAGESNPWQPAFGLWLILKPEARNPACFRRESDNRPVEYPLIIVPL